VETILTPQATVPSLDMLVSNIISDIAKIQKNFVEKQWKN